MSASDRFATMSARAKRALRSLSASYFLLDGEGATLSRSLRLLARAARVAALLALLLAAFTVLDPGWMRRGNLALHHPATASGAEFGSHPGDAVDGTRYGQLGFHSTLSDPRLTVDLEARAMLSRIDVYGRADCCFDQSLPLRISTSLDGETFDELATWTTPFSQEEPWSLDVSPPVSARYVRLTTLKKSPLVVGEVEIFGSRQ